MEKRRNNIIAKDLYLTLDRVRKQQTEERTELASYIVDETVIDIEDNVLYRLCSLFMASFTKTQAKAVLEEILEATGDRLSDAREEKAIRDHIMNAIKYETMCAIYDAFSKILLHLEEGKYEEMYPS